MKTWTVSLALSVLLAGTIIGCSGNGANPLVPSDGPDITGASSVVGISLTHLWGYWDVVIDVENQTVEAVSDRSAMFTANVVNFLNGKPTCLAFSINGITTGAGYIDVDIDVGITHPFPGLPQYNGYDVRGVFMGDGSATLGYNSDLKYGAPGTDQFMMPNPDTGKGGPDGFTRWYNRSEFAGPGMPLFTYTPGLFASSNFNGTATVCPYKYFADGLGTDEDLWSWIIGHSDQDGQFSSGAKNERNYYLRFPNAKGVTYGYAVIANWEGDAPEFHPSNAQEAVACDVIDNSDVWYVSDTENGGKLDLEFSLFGWKGLPDNIYIESTVLSVPHTLDASEMVPTGGDDIFSTWSVEITADDINGTEGNDFWIIAEYANFGYGNEFGVHNDAEGDPLAGFFRYDLDVAPESGCGNLVPVIDILNGTDHFIAVTREYTGWIIEGDNFEDGDPGVALNDGDTDVVYGTNVEWVDVNTITCDIDLTDVQPGTYDLVVINGCGAQERGIAVGMVEVLRHIAPIDPTNIDVVTGYAAPRDITVNPASDQVGISYTNYWVNWSDDYDTHSSQHLSWFNPFNNQNVQFWYWDSQPNLIWYAHEASPWYPGQNECWSWTDWTGWQSTHSQWQPGPNDEMKDIANVQGSNQIWAIFDWADNTSGPYCSFILSTADYTINYPAHVGAPWYNGTGTTGVVMDNLLAIDMAQCINPNFDIYILEDLPADDTAVVEKWRVNENPPSIEQPTYTGVSFGEGFLYDPLDITVDEDYYVYVLEINADGDPVVWAYDPLGNLVGTSEPCPVGEISGDPLRIDASLSANQNEVHVLHSEGVTMFAMN